MNRFEMVAAVGNRGDRWSSHFGTLRRRVREPGAIVEGKLSRAAGLTLEATGCAAALGARCLIEGADGAHLEAEVVGFENDRLFLMPTSNLTGVMPNAHELVLCLLAGLMVFQTARILFIRKLFLLITTRDTTNDMSLDDIDCSLDCIIC